MKINTKKVILFNIFLLFLWVVLPVFRGILPDWVSKVLFLIISIITLLLIGMQRIVQYSKYMIGFYLYFFVLVFYSIIGYGDAGINQYIAFLFLPLWFIFSIYVTNNCSKSDINRLLAIGLFCLFLTLLSTCIVLLKDSYASRILTSSSSDPLLRKRYEAMNVASYDLIYGSILLIPVLLKRDKNQSKKALICKLSLTVLIILTVILANFMSAYFLLIVVVVLSVVRVQKRNIVLLVIAFGILYATGVINNILLFILKGIADNSNSIMIVNRTQHLIDFVNGTGNLTDSTSRFELIAQSFSSFLSNPIFGKGAYYSLRNGIIGGHSTLVDDLGRYGIIFSSFVYVSFYKIFIKMYKDTKLKLELVYSVVAFIILSILNPIYNYGIVLAISFIIPCVIGNNKAETSEFERIQQ